MIHQPMMCSLKLMILHMMINKQQHINNAVQHMLQTVMIHCTGIIGPSQRRVFGCMILPGVSFIMTVVTHVCNMWNTVTLLLMMPPVTSSNVLHCAAIYLTIIVVVDVMMVMASLLMLSDL